MVWVSECEPAAHMRAGCERGQEGPATGAEFAHQHFSQNPRVHGLAV